jgi:hypothetical protein
MSKFSEDLFDISSRLRALEFKQAQRDIDEIRHRVERLESAKRADQSAKQIEGR